MADANRIYDLVSKRPALVAVAVVVVVLVVVVIAVVI
jgi:hypothetical protein